jgi:glycosyltransferase involved in cell wall biosynthesis
MRIAMLSPVWFPVPPTGYGGIETIVELLTEGLVREGHDVTLFASGDSTTSANLVSVFDRAPSERIGQTFWELDHAMACVGRIAEFDVVHDHTGLLGLSLLGLAGAPLVHTVHGPLTGDPGRIYNAVCDTVPAPGLVSLTQSQRRPAPHLPWLANVPNAIDMTKFPLDPQGTDDLVFLGRMTPDKGAHRAIEVARHAGRRLRIAAKCREPAEHDYFRRYVEPELDDQIQYLGEVDHEQRTELLCGARALLFPIDWEEPFGLAMIEAMACGTPVIATNRGSVPEIVTDGRTGIVTETLDEMVAGVEAVEVLDRAAIRREVEERFSVGCMLDGYLDAYETVADLREAPISVAAA